MKATDIAEVQDPAERVQWLVARFALGAAVVFLPVMAVLHVLRIQEGTYDALAAGRMVLHLGLIAVLVAWPRRKLAGAMMVVYLVVAMVHSALQYGIAPAGGLLAVLMVVVGHLYFDVRGLVATAVLQTLVVVGLAIAGVQGLLGEPLPGSMAADSWVVWLRVGVAQTVMVVAIGSAVAGAVAVSRRKAARLARTLRDEQAQRVEAEQARVASEQARKALVEAQQMQAVGRVAAGVAHDLGNALAVVLGSAELLAERELGSADRVLVREILEGSRSAALTARYLLTLSRQDVTEPERLDVSAELVRVSSALRRILPDDIEVRVQASARVAIVADRVRLERMLVNLALNARDAMPTGGELVLAGAGRDGQVRIEVRDSGVGMDADTVSRVFEPLFTTRSGAGGFGMGLAVVRELAEEAGGTVEIHSEPGRGTTVSLVFPEAGETAPQRAVPLSVDEIPRGLAVLLLEDQPAVRAAMDRALRRIGCVTVVCGDGRAAIEAMERGDFELLVTDGVVPGEVPVKDVLAAWRARSPGLPVVVVSGHVEEELVRRGIAAGQYAFVAKPFSLHGLKRAITEAIRQSHSVRASGTR